MIGKPVIQLSVMFPGQQHFRFRASFGSIEEASDEIYRLHSLVEDLHPEDWNEARYKIDVRVHDSRDAE